MSENKSLLSRIFTWAMLVLLAILALKVAGWLLGFLFGLVGMVFGIAIFLAFTVAPVLVLGWLTLKAWRAFTKEPAV